MRQLGLAALGLLLFLHPASSLTCPCSVNARQVPRLLYLPPVSYHLASSQVLTCNPGTITNFPEDVLSPCSLRPSDILGIELSQQPLTTLESGAFIDFPNLQDLMLSVNNITTVAPDTFTGLTQLHNIFLKDNNITRLAKGTFDDLTSLRLIDVRGNTAMDPLYETTSWHMCHRADNNLLVQGNLTFAKELERSETTEAYCDQVLERQEYQAMCLTNTSIVDCRGIDNIDDAVCFLRAWGRGDLPSPIPLPLEPAPQPLLSTFTNVLFDFPVDTEPIKIEDFFEGESNTFFQEFNGFPNPGESGLTTTQIVRNLTLYTTIFDLADLPKLTSQKTREVTIWADSVVVSAPITVSYRTIIKARRVSIDQKITMNITRELLLDSELEVEAWAMKEEHVTIKDLHMRSRKFGLLEVLDEVPQSHMISSKKCQPAVKNAIAESLDLSNWFDFTHLNLMYVCARTIQGSKQNPLLVGQIANFTLDYTFNSSLVQNQKAYTTARKFKRIQELEVARNVHNVPSYSVDQVKDLAEVMHQRMQDYRNTELAQEQQLLAALARVEDMQVQFDIIEAEQELYFSMEMIQLEAMWAATDNAWNFSFEHRNGIEDSIGTAMEAMMNQTFEMRDKELVQMLAEAEMSVEHIKDVIAKYRSQIDRYLAMAKASFAVQQEEFYKLGVARTTFREEFRDFERAVEEWQYEQTVKAAFSIFSAISSVFSGDIDGIMDAVGNLPDILSTIMDLQDVWSMMKEIEDMIADMNLDDLSDISIDPSTNFITALNRAVDMKLKGPTFDVIQATARIKLDAMNAATDYAISHTVEVMMALQSIADLGNRLVGEVAEFADNMLSLAERFDEIGVALADQERAVEEVEAILKMIEDFELEKDLFYSERNRTKQEYEDAINQMREDYENMTAEMREEYRKQITEKFETFKLTFSTLTDSYNTRMSLLIESIQRKSYGLKEHSMNQRTMILALFMDFCDTLFFHSFGRCDTIGMPLMSDNFDNLLEKLSSIQWDAITADDAFPPNQRPQPFPFLYVYIEDDLEGLHYPIQILKNESILQVNLQDYDTLDGFSDYWRIRLKKIKISLLDENNELIDSPGETGQLGGSIKVKNLINPQFFQQYSRSRSPTPQCSMTATEPEPCTHSLDKTSSAMPTIGLIQVTVLK